MPLHPDAAAFLARTATMPQPYDMTIEEFRAQAAALIPTGMPLEIGSVTDHLIAGGDGQDLKIRVYRPERPGPRPVLVWLHGGSFTRGTLDMFDPGRRQFVKESGAIVVAVDQRLSPETRFPAPLEDGYAALLWVAENIGAIGGDPSRIGIAGESSGGNLAAGVVRLALDRPGPKPAFQLLVAPTLDPTLSANSMTELATGYLLTREQLRWAFEQYAPDADHNDPRLAALALDDLTGTIPTAVLTLEFDPARDDGEIYANRLRKAGTIVRQARIAGYIHHFQGPDFPAVQVRLLTDLLADMCVDGAGGAGGC